MKHSWLILLTALLLMPTADAQRTPLDSALVAAQQDASLAGRFYDQFLRAELHVPTWEAGGEQEGRYRADEGETFAPVLIEADGARFMPVFDRLDRLQAWAQREITYITMPAHALVTVVAEMGGVHLALNVGTDYFKDFVPEELAQLHDSVASGEETAFAAGTEFLIGALGEVPEGLLPALRAELGRNAEVQEAYLARVQVVGEPTSGFVVVLETGETGREHFEAIQHALGVAARSHIPEGEYLMVVPLGTGVFGREALNEIEPFFARRP